MLDELVELLELDLLVLPGRKRPWTCGGLHDVFLDEQWGVCTSCQGNGIAGTSIHTREHAICAAQIDGCIEGRALDTVNNDAADVATQRTDKINGECVRDGTLGRVSLERGGNGRRLHGANPDGKHEVFGDVLTMLCDAKGDDRWHGKEADDERFDIYQYHCAPPFERLAFIIDNLSSLP